MENIYARKTQIRKFSLRMTWPGSCTLLLVEQGTRLANIYLNWGQDSMPYVQGKLKFEGPLILKLLVNSSKSISFK